MDGLYIYTLFPIQPRLPAKVYILYSRFRATHTLSEKNKGFYFKELNQSINLVYYSLPGFISLSRINVF